MNSSTLVRLAAVGTVVSITLFLLFGRGFGVWKEYTNNEKARLVVVNAFAVGHPGNYVVFEDLKDEDIDVRPHEGSISVLLGPRSPYFDGTFQGHRYRTSLKLLSSGALDPSWLMETGATRAVDALSEGDETDVRSAAATLGGIEGQVAVTVFVWLTRPLGEDVAQESWRNGFDTIFLGPLHTGISPISWSPSACNWRGIGNCDAEMMRSPVGQFRRWASLLDEKDEPVLKQLNLDLQEIRDRAQQGLVHGYLATGHPDELIKLSKDPSVRQMQIVDVIFED
ncbi:hypothetical protein ACLQ2R_18990 [Streptosporangium sp. DT93]|uniref:hypothetical protein n=1 Tax=Streptosporangium sp. DT93 TaxID=3393428 RepID=UPI003CF3AA06